MYKNRGAPLFPCGKAYYLRANGIFDEKIEISCDPCYDLTMERLTKAHISLLLAWYEANKRTLPWREDVTPYRVWVSEIMLQQTRVEAAKGYYARWISRFPTVADLANADEEEVLKLWEGLGYYSRARNLHKAAKIVMENFHGDLPADIAALRTLPGVGAYTVGAILSIAFGVKEPAVDGNVVRVVSRLTAREFDPARDDAKKEIGDELRPLMPEGQTSEFTQSLFELGALICLPNAFPKCEECPLSERCAAHRLGKETDYPARPVKAEKRREKLTVFVVEYDGKYAIKKRPDKGLLAGLWELPNAPGTLTKEQAAALYGKSVTPLPAATHVFTHVIWEMTGYLLHLSEPPKAKDALFVTPQELSETYSLPSAFSKYKKYCL